MLRVHEDGSIRFQDHMGQQCVLRRCDTPDALVVLGVVKNIQGQPIDATMMLSKQAVAELQPMLELFVKTGEIDMKAFIQHELVRLYEDGTWDTVRVKVPDNIDCSDPAEGNRIANQYMGGDDCPRKVINVFYSGIYAGPEGG